jgi:hypothetical protein
MMERHEIGWIICEEHCGRKFKSEIFLNAHLERVEEQIEKLNSKLYNFQSDYQLGESIKSSRESSSDR